jgi:dTMP kinase
VATLNAFATAGLEPDAVIWLKLPPEQARGRVASRTDKGGEASRIDAEAARFHDTVFEAFARLAADDPKRFIVLDASAAPRDIYLELMRHPRWVALFGALNE